MAEAVEANRAGLIEKYWGLEVPKRGSILLGMMDICQAVICKPESIE